MAGPRYEDEQLIETTSQNTTLVRVPSDARWPTGQKNFGTRFTAHEINAAKRPGRAIRMLIYSLRSIVEHEVPMDRMEIARPRQCTD